MIRLTPTAKIIYGLLSQSVLSLLLLMVALLLAELQRLPVASLVSSFPIQFAPLSQRLYDALIVTGFVTGGLVMCLEDVNAKYLLWIVRLWVVIVVLGVLVSSAVLAIGLIAFWGMIYAQPNRTRFLTIWQIGMVLIIVALPIQALASNSALTTLLVTHVAYGVTAVSITFWLMTRWSNIHDEWARDGVTTVAGTVTVAGLLVSLAKLPVPPIYGLLASIIILPCYTILAGHHYRALRDRTHDMSLSGHWIAMATVFWLAVGFIGVVTAQTGIRDVMQRTQFIQAQLTLVRWVMVMVVLGLLNYTASYLRGENRRVTGYMPLWLIGFGIGLTVIIRLCSGVVEIYLREFVGIASTAINSLLLPVTIAEMLCWFGVTVGVIIYALGFVARRPKIITL